MEDTLVKLMSNFIKLTDEEALSIKEAFPIKKVTKGTHLLKQGVVAKEAFLVINGCVRKYTITANGDEHTLDFYTDYQSIANLNSIANKTPSNFFLTCTEDSIIAIMNTDAETTLYKKHPRFGEVCRVQMEKMMGEHQENVEIFMRSTPKERYLQLLKNRPELINKVPQYQLASYLGVKPETLSRIRKKISLGN